jgi:small-conductance mechanosensitive channel
MVQGGGILVVGYFMAKFIGFVLSSLLKNVGFDKLSTKVGIIVILKKAGIKHSPSEIVGAIGFWIIMLTFLVTATESLGLERVSSTIDEVVLYLPRVIAAALIFIVGLFLSSFSRDIVRSSAEGLGVSYAKPLGNAAYGILFIVIVSLVINGLEIETELLNSVISILIAAIGIALALSLGLGTRELSSNVVAGYYARDIYSKKARISMSDFDGTIDKIGSVKTIINCEDGSKLTIPNAILISTSVSIQKK